jgi:hypothetical protein
MPVSTARRIDVKTLNCAAFLLGMSKRGTSGSVVVKALSYKPEGRGFENQ